MPICTTCRGEWIHDREHSCAAVFASRAEHLRNALDLALERLEALTNEHEELRACASLVLARLPKHPWRQSIRMALDALERLVNA